MPAAVLQHAQDCGAGGGERAHQVGLDDVAPAGVFHLVKRPCTEGRAGDKIVEASEMRIDCCENFFQIFGVARVGSKTAVFAQACLRKRLAEGGSIASESHDAPAQRGQRQDSRPADASGPAGNE